MNNVEIMTQAGYDKLKQKLISASADRDEALSAIAESKKQGGEHSENSEFIEAKDHPFFVATQAHPEFKSRPHRPHPLFAGFVATILDNK